MFGGRAAAAARGPTVLEWDGLPGPGGPPHQRRRWSSSIAAAYDAVNRTTVIFGGSALDVTQ
jgi:hypothetical protein